jgi:ferredoxin
LNAPPEVQTTRCVRYRYRYSACTRCEQACPHDAVRLSDEGAAVAADRCKACGLCVAACPTETFSMPGLSPRALIEAARGRESLTIACISSSAAGEVELPCLGALAPSLLAYLLSQGTRLQLAGSAHCADCSHGSRGAAQLAAHLDALDTLRAADRDGRWAALTLPQDSERPAPRVPANPERRQPGGEALRAARRGFFRRVAHAGAKVPAPRPVAHAVAIPLRAIRAARTAPSAQRDLMQMLGLAEMEAALPAHPSLPAGELRLDPGCTGCEACARACPTAALHVRENASAWAIGFEAVSCVACGVCVEACQPRVLHLSETVPAANFGPPREPVALHGMPKRRCTRCDRSFIVTGAGELCEVCAGDQEDFDAIFG